ncbi:hypothetical protein M5K25_013668 [Dendrobium thyrsiflorum]|uniref:Uncharacterized protein n=1 Tax=Dendrobium thyrsiflorum TaxID=117978 RepID=A0ABD0V0U4_DENTH
MSQGFNAIGEHTGAGHNRNIVMPFGGESLGSEGPDIVLRSPKISAASRRLPCLGENPRNWPSPRRHVGASVGASHLIRTFLSFPKAANTSSSTIEEPIPLSWNPSHSVRKKYT